MDFRHAGPRRRPFCRIEYSGSILYSPLVGLDGITPAGRPASSLGLGARSCCLPLTGSASRSTDSEPSLFRKGAPILTQRSFLPSPMPATMV
jgi:hypothetical protein